MDNNNQSPRLSASGAIPSAAPIPQRSDGQMAGVSDPERERREAERQAYIKQIDELASLVNHPGWKQIKQAIQGKIDDYRSGKEIAAGIQNGNISNARLGEEVRVAYRMAHELEGLLTQVESAVKESGQQRKRKASDRVRPLPRH